MKQSNPILIAVALSALLGLASADAKLYRWVDDNGEVHFSDRVPPKDSQLERGVYSIKGNYQDTVEAAKTKEELEEEALRAAEAARRQEALEVQQRRDRVLLETFGSVGEMEIARDERLAIVDSHIRLLEHKIAAFNDKWGKVKADFNRIKKNGKEPPAHIIAEAKQVRAKLVAAKTQLKAKRQERAAIESRFTADISRFQELHQK